MRCRLTLLLITAVAFIVCGRGTAGAQTADDLFDDQLLHRIDVYIHSKDWTLLKANYLKNTHYPADLRWQGQAVRNAGVRSHGRFTRSSVKPSLNFDFDRYASGQTFLGLRSVVLKNLGEDASTVRNFLAMKMLRRLGVPAPRTAFATVYVNNTYMGLYEVVENVDAVTAGRLFGESTGHLFEYNWLDEWGFEYLGSDLAEYARRFEPVEDSYSTSADLYGPFEAWCRLANEAPAFDFAAGIGQYVDVVALARFVAAQSFMAEFDGLTGNRRMNNVYVYRSTGTTVHRFIAWDEDLACFSYNLPLTFGHDMNVLVRRLMEMPSFREIFLATLLEAAGLAEQIVPGASTAVLREAKPAAAPARAIGSRGEAPRVAGGRADAAPALAGRRVAGEPDRGWLESEALRALNLVRQAVYRDSLKRFSNEQFEADAAFVVEVCQLRAWFVRWQVALAGYTPGPGAATVRRR